MTNRSMKTILSMTVTAMYAAVVAVLFFVVLEIGKHKNGATAIVFEAIGVLALAAVILTLIYAKDMHIGHKSTIITMTVIYTVLLDILNFCLCAKLKSGTFLLLNLLLVLAYMLVTVPMIYMGIRNIENTEEK